MAHAVKYDFTPLESYLVGERDVNIRSEYVDGLVYAMARASRTHNTEATYGKKKYTKLAKSSDLESVALDVPVTHIYRRVRKEVGLEV